MGWYFFSTNIQVCCCPRAIDDLRALRRKVILILHRYLFGSLPHFGGGKCRRHVSKKYIPTHNTAIDHDQLRFRWREVADRVTSCSSFDRCRLASTHRAQDSTIDLFSKEVSSASGVDSFTPFLSGTSPEFIIAKDHVVPLGSSTGYQEPGIIVCGFVSSSINAGHCVECKQPKLRAGPLGW